MMVRSCTVSTFNSVLAVLLRTFEHATPKPNIANMAVIMRRFISLRQFLMYKYTKKRKNTVPLPPFLWVVVLYLFHVYQKDRAILFANIHFFVEVMD
jgi:hypothetical protein